MPRQRTTTLSRRRFEGFTRDQLYSEIHSLIAEPYLADSWGPIFSGLSAAPVLDDLPDLQHLLDHVTNDSLIDCALALGTALESALESAQESATIRSTRKARRKQRPSSAIRVTTSEDWLRARERRIQKTLQSSRRNGAPRETTDDPLRHKLQDAQDLAAKNQSEIEALRARLQNSEQEREQYEQQLSVAKVDLQEMVTAHEQTNTELICLRQQMMVQEVTLVRLQTDLDRALEIESLRQSALYETRMEMRQKETALATVSENLQACEAERDELRAQRDGLEVALHIAKNERKRTLNQLMGELNAVPRRQGSFSDAPGGVCADEITYWIDDAFASGSRSPSSYQSAEGSSSSRETDGDTICAPAEFPPQCCDQTPVARTNAGCELCPDHCEQFTWFSPAEMGPRPRTRVTTCPACNGPRCESAELSSYYGMN